MFFKVTYDRGWHYDEFDAFAVITDDEDDAFAVVLEYLEQRHREFWGTPRKPSLPPIPESQWGNDNDSQMWSQRDHVIIEPIEQRGVVVASYRAG